MKKEYNYDNRVIYVDKDTHQQLKTKASSEGKTLKTFMKDILDKI